MPSPAPAPESEPGAIIFGRLAEMWRSDFVEKSVGGKALLAAPTRAKYIFNIEKYILPRWKDTRLEEFRAKEVLDWLQDTCASWHNMADLRSIMSGVITKAQEWELLPETFANPIHRVKLPKKWEVREKRILDEDQTARVLARLEDPNLLICETCLDTGTRISEVTGLKVKHVDFDKGCIRIDQRNWRGDIDEPKTAKSKRVLALGDLGPRYKIWIGETEASRPGGVGLPAGRRPEGADVGLRRPSGAQEGGERRRLRLPRLRAALPAPRQHHMAAGSRRQQHRSQQDRRPRQHQDHGGVHDRPVEAARRTNAPDSRPARESREEGQ